MNEPVAWHYPDGKPDQCTTDKAYAEKDPAWTPMYYKHEWVGLTDEEQGFVYGSIHEVPSRPTPWPRKPFWIAFADAIEAKLKEKNT
jgi:hypothetical protein